MNDFIKPFVVKKEITLYISYFYQIRNMTPNMLPISTAMWDPKWFHDGKGNNYKYIDKNGVINGVRMENLTMPFSKWDELVKRNESCICCGTNNNFFNFGMCPFMQEYGKSIRTNNPDFQKFLDSCARYLEFLEKRFNLCLDTIVFIVYEDPSRICGERPMLQQWFVENGMGLKEWTSDAIYK